VSERDWLPEAVRTAGVKRTLEPGESLFRQGARTVGLYEVLSGKVRLVRVDRSGREAVLYSASAGETIAEASLFSPTYHCDAVAAMRAVVLLYPKAAILAEFRRDPKVAEAFMAILGRQIMNLRSSLEQHNIHSARDRIRHYLAANLGPDGLTVTLQGTLKDLAANLGLTHEAFYRTLAKMQRDGEIQRLKGKIRLVTPAYDPGHT
jgi:CRP/FNR family transcriptional regulator, dissimilatory nitrate respiration regulator